MRRLLPIALVAVMVAPALAQRAASRATVISTGRRVTLTEHLRREGTTVFLFVNATSAMEQAFVADLEARLPESDRLALRLIQVRDLQAPVAVQHEITATPTALVLDRFGRTLARTSEPDEIVAAVGKGLRMGRLRWIEETDPRAPEVYRTSPERLRRGLPGIVKTMSLRSDVMEMFRIMSEIHFSEGYLDRRTHELIAAYVSALNECKF